MNTPTKKSKLVILWTAPRSLSSAVYQSMTTLKSTNIKCFFELYMYPYCFGSPTDTSTITPDRSLPIEPTYAAATKALLQSYSGVDVVFTKEMAKCLPTKESPQYAQILENLSHARHAFLLRDPASCVYSRYKMSKKKPTGYQTYNELDAGLIELYDLYYYVTKNLGHVPVVIDAADLQDNPQETMRLFCEAIDVPFESHMVTWEAGKVDIKMPVYDWDTKYFDTLRTSTGFIKIPYSEQKPVPSNELTSEMVEYIERCQPHYKTLLAQCIRLQAK